MLDVTLTIKGDLGFGSVLLFPCACISPTINAYCIKKKKKTKKIYCLFLPFSVRFHNTNYALWEHTVNMVTFYFCLDLR